MAPAADPKRLAQPSTVARGVTAASSHGSAATGRLSCDKIVAFGDNRAILCDVVIASAEQPNDSSQDTDAVRSATTASNAGVREPADAREAEAGRGPVPDRELEDERGAQPGARVGQAELASASLPLSPTFRFFVNFWRTGRTLGDTLSSRLGRDHGLDLRDYLVLNSIFKGRRYPTELADHLQIGKDIVSRIVNKLMHEGLIDRSIDAQDSRRTRLAVTAAGLQRRDAIKDTIEHTIAPLLELLGADRRDAMTDSLASFNQLLLERLDPAGPPSGVESTERDGADEPDSRHDRHDPAEAPRPEDLA